MDDPKHFLADTPEEAEKLYKEFLPTLEYWTYNYSMATGLNKDDLFSETLIGLRNAKRKFDKNRGYSFRNFAIGKIKDELNKYVRQFYSIISIPAYVKNANRRIHQLIDLLMSRGAGEDTINILLSGETTEVPEDIADECQVLLRNIQGCANRASVSFVEMVDRAGSLPLDFCYEDNIKTENQHEEKMFTALVVESLKKYMDETELRIAESIMEGKTYVEIGKEHNRTDGWVAGKIGALRERLLDKFEL